MSFRSSRELLAMIAAYITQFPEEKARLDTLQRHVDQGLPVWNRHTPSGHMTASAFILDKDKQHCLIIHHKKLNLWIQPGGHIESFDHFLWEAARREAEEETGLTDLVYLPVNKKDLEIPFDLDTHIYPEILVKKQAEHYHFDCRYVFFCANSTQPNIQESEVHHAEWLNIQYPEKGEASFMNTLRKLRSSPILK